MLSIFDLILKKRWIYTGWVKKLTLCQKVTVHHLKNCSVNSAIVSKYCEMGLFCGIKVELPSDYATIDTMSFVKFTCI